jgi:hypothetical protein
MAGLIELLIRGDDMGISHSANKAFIKAYQDGIIGGASLMPCASYYKEAVEICKQNPNLSTGIHLTLITTNPIRPILGPDEVPSIHAPDGYMYRCFEDFNAAKPKLEDIRKEMRAQIGAGWKSGLDLVYLDWHMGGFDPEFRVYDYILELCNQFKLLYAQDPTGELLGAKHCGLYIEGWDYQKMPDGNPYWWSFPEFTEEKRLAFINMLKNLEEGTWWMAVHPTFECQGSGIVELICSNEVKDIIEEHGIKILTHKDLWVRKFGSCN